MNLHSNKYKVTQHLLSTFIDDTGYTKNNKTWNHMIFPLCSLLPQPCSWNCRRPCTIIL